MRQSWPLMLLLSSCCLSNAQDRPAANDHSRYTILYTGRTLGYARSPNVDTEDGTPSDPNTVAREYMELFQTLETGASGPVLRLGLGDNFAPDFLARTLDQGHGKFRLMKDRDVFLDHDNVAQFLIETHYRAVVPGKHDFYCGAQHLVDLAGFLAAHGVQMLGANLIVSSQVANATPRIPERLNSHPYRNDFGAVSVDLPDVVLPYKRRFSIANARQVRPAGGSSTFLLLRPHELAANKRPAVQYEYQLEDPQICWETGPVTVSNPDRVPLPNEGRGNCVRLKVADDVCPGAAGMPARQSTCKAIFAPDGNPASATASSTATYIFEDESAGLHAGLNHLFCAKIQDRQSAENPWTCQPFFVEVPMFEYPQASGTVIPRPFVTVAAGGDKVAVFGVVDPDLLANIGLLNSGWLNNNHRLDTLVKVAAPDDSLTQVLDQCNREDDCRTARKVLLAQMSYARAAQLIAKVGVIFDAVISQADSSHYTPERSTSESGPAGKFQPQIILTPPMPYGFTPAAPSTLPQETPFTPIVSRAIVEMSSPKNPPPGSLAAWSIQNVFKTAKPYISGRTCSAPPCTTLRQLSEVALDEEHSVNVPEGLSSQTAILAPPPPATGEALSDPVRDLALTVMRKQQRTDLAMLQKRDLFDADFLSSQPIAPADIQDQLNRMFWKGDFLITVYVTGAQLKSIIKQSKKFDAIDRDPLTTEVEQGRALQILGVFNDPKDPSTYYVNGAKVDDAALYSAATTTFLGPGDTGYADLTTPAVPPPLRLEDRDFGHLRSLSGVICHAMVKIYPGPTCDDEPLGDWYLDASKERPSDATAGYNAIAHYRTFPKRFGEPPVPTVSTVQGNAQQRHFLSLTLENADFNYSATLLRRFSSLASTFAGVSAPGVTIKGTKNYGEDYRLRLVYDYRVGTAYFLTDSSFQRTFTTGSYIPSTPNNMWGVEGGGTLRMLWWKRPAWLAFQYAGRFEGQLFQPDTASISYPDQTLPALLVPPRTSTVYGRFGLRATFADTYVEGGFEEIDSRHVLSQYSFNGTTFCEPSAQDQFDCGSSSSGPFDTPISKLPQLAGMTAHPSGTSDYLTGGLYLNFNLKFPIWSRFSPSGTDQSWYFVLANKGDFYFNASTDTSVQTRYLDKLTPSLNFPIFGSFMLSPKVDIVLYENKINHSRFRAVEPMVSLSYAFKWRQGMNFYRALRYGAISPPSPTASQ